MFNKLINIFLKLFTFLSIFILLNIFLNINLQTFKGNIVFSQSISTGLNISKEELDKGVTNSGHSLEGFKKSSLNQENILNTFKWSATNYVEKDILSNIYTVQLGDTLWEISEAFYGSGFNWVNILDKNINSIGFLYDGTQALIVEGQILNL